MTRATAALGRFPYAHRTVADIWDLERRMEEGMFRLSGSMRDDGGAAIVALLRQTQSAQMTETCPRCGGRWCEHRKAAA